MRYLIGLTLAGLMACATMAPVKYQVVETGYLGDESRVTFGPTLTCTAQEDMFIERLEEKCRRMCERRVVELNVADGIDARRNHVQIILGRTLRVCRRLK